jgi:hypothetical protein
MTLPDAGQVLRVGSLTYFACNTRDCRKFVTRYGKVSCRVLFNDVLPCLIHRVRFLAGCSFGDQRWGCRRDLAIWHAFAAIRCFAFKEKLSGCVVQYSCTQHMFLERPTRGQNELVCLFYLARIQIQLTMHDGSTIQSASLGRHQGQYLDDDQASFSHVMRTLSW